MGTNGQLQEPNVKLDALISEAGMSRAGLARRVVDAAAEHGVERRYSHIDVGRWIKGAGPSGIIPSLIVEILGARLARPVSLPDAGFTATPDAALMGAGSYHANLTDAVAAVLALGRVDGAPEATMGREAVDAAAWGDLMVRWLLAPDVAAPSTRDWDNGQLRAITWATDMFSKLDYQFGGGYARTSLVAFLKSELAPLLGRPDGVRPELLQPAAALLRLAGWTAYDTGHHGLASGYLAQALRFAQAAGDRALGGRILAGMSHQAHFLGYDHRAVELARAAQHGAQGHATPTAMALFHAMEARALAGLGDRSGTEAALLAADGWFHKRTPDNDPPWLRYFDSAELAAEFAHSYRDLGVADKAIEFGLIAVNEADPLYARSIAFCRCVLAAGHLGAGEVEQGLELASEAVATVASLRSIRARAYVSDFVGRLDGHSNHASVSAFVTQTRAVMQAGGPGSSAA